MEQHIAFFSHLEGFFFIVMLCDFEKTHPPGCDQLQIHTPSRDQALQATMPREISGCNQAPAEYGSKFGY